MLFSPETTKPMREFVEVLLRGPQSTLTPAEREMIATLFRRRTTVTTASTRMEPRLPNTWAEITG
jgi:hypothetical protein